MAGTRWWRALLVRPSLQLEEEEEPWWGSKWEDSKGKFVFGSLGVWGRGASSLCTAGVLEICAEAAAPGGHLAFRALRPVLALRWPQGPQNWPRPLP